MQTPDAVNINTLARIAVYDDMLASPRVIDIAPAPVLDFIEKIASTSYEAARQLGGSLPYTVIREIVENFIHADFAECTVSVLDGGNTLRFSDQGPGIPKKTLVLQPGVSSATYAMRKYIRGVGSGFPIVKEYLEHSRGFLSIEDNALDGVVVTIAIAAPDATALPTTSSPVATALRLSGTPEPEPVVHSVPVLHSPAQTSLQHRENKALALLLREGMLGPVDLGALLGVSAPTATRILQKLENLGMVETTQLKKRILSNVGLAYVQQQLGTDQTL